VPKRRAFLIAAALAACASPGRARAQGVNVQITNAWARAAAQGRVAAVYLDLLGGPDRLLEASTDVAGRVELHETIMDDGVMRMRPVGGIAIGAGLPTRLAPGGLHIMLIDLKRPLREGETFPLTLRFERAGRATVTVTVQRAGAAGPAGGHAGHGRR
jgi:hypothetical protein